MTYKEIMNNKTPCNTCALKDNIYTCPDQQEDVTLCVGDYIPLQK